MPDLFVKRTKHDYAYAGRSLQSTYLSAALMHSEATFSLLLFSYLVQEFKMSPSKTKAVFIWEHCLEGIGKHRPADEYDPNSINIEIDECGLPGALERIELKIRELRAAQFTASSMNKAMRTLTALQRRAPENLFDAFLAAHVARLGDSPWKDLQNHLHEGKISVDFIYKKHRTEHLPKLQRKLEAADFVWMPRILLGISRT
jgi:hypothetical protein